jgi:predicted metal-dependent TIM-barrel fold hydrolase
VLALLNYAKEKGVRRMLINHPDFVIDASEKNVQEFVRLGAYIEHSMCMYHPESTFHLWDFDRLLRWIQLVGPERTLLGSDLGQKNNPLPVEGLRFTIEKLLDQGIKEHEIEMMVKKNAAELLGLEGAVRLARAAS